jgi:hypothetical protein
MKSGFQILIIAVSSLFDLSHLQPQYQVWFLINLQKMWAGNISMCDLTVV